MSIEGGLALAEKLHGEGWASTLLWAHDLPSGDRIFLYQTLFNVRLCVGPPDSGSFDRGWCYTGGFGHALAAAIAWMENGEDEPPWWNKNLQTGEWREDGRA